MKETVSSKKWIAFCIHDQPDMNLPLLFTVMPFFSGNQLKFTDNFIKWRGFRVNTSKIFNTIKPNLFNLSQNYGKSLFSDNWKYLFYLILILYI